MRGAGGDENDGQAARRQGKDLGGPPLHAGYMRAPGGRQERQETRRRAEEQLYEEMREGREGYVAALLLFPHRLVSDHNFLS